MTPKAKQRVHPYTLFESLIRHIAEQTENPQAASADKRVKGALESLFGDWRKIGDGRGKDRIMSTHDLMPIVELIDLGKAKNAREAARLHYGEKGLEFLARRDGVSVESLLRRFDKYIKENPERCRNPSAYNLMASFYRGVPEQSMFFEGRVLAEWIVSHEKLVNFSVANRKKKQS